MLDSLPGTISDNRAHDRMAAPLEQSDAVPIPDLTDRHLVLLYNRFSIFAASLVLLTSLAVLVLWLLGIPYLSSIHPSWIALKPNTTVAFGALGGALLLVTTREDGRDRLRTLVVVGCAVLAIAVGGASLLEDLVGVNIGIDELLFRDLPGAVATTHPGRPGPAASVLLILVGAALPATIAPNSRFSWLVGFCCVPTLFVAMTLLIAYAVDARELYTLGGHATPTSFMAVVLFILLATGTMCQNPQHLLFRRLASGGAGGLMLRKVLPLVVATNTAVVAVRLWTQGEGLFGTIEFGAAATASLSSLFMFVIFFVYARRMDSLETARRVAEAREIQLNAILQERLIDLQEANRELEEFSYSVSHDLRTPLRAIDGFSGILVEDYGDRLDSEGQRIIGVVRDGTRKMAQLIDGILGFSRVGRVEMSTVSVDMNDLIEGLLPEFKGPMAGRDISIAVAPLPPAQGDRMMLRRVWQNLLDNAIKYTSEKESARIEVGSNRDAGELMYWIKDNGTGFDMRYADKLFGMFHRLHRVDEFGGTGIGLAIVKRIVTRHGGRVWAEGQPDHGATFYFALPVRSEGYV